MPTFYCYYLGEGILLMVLLFFFIYNKLELEVFFLMNGLRPSSIVRNNNPIRDVILYNLREKKTEA